MLIYCPFLYLCFNYFFFVFSCIFISIFIFLYDFVIRSFISIRLNIVSFLGFNLLLLFIAILTFYYVIKMPLAMFVTFHSFFMMDFFSIKDMISIITTLLIDSLRVVCSHNLILFISFLSEYEQTMDEYCLISYLYTKLTFFKVIMVESFFFVCTFISLCLIY